MVTLSANICAMSLRYPAESFTKPSIMLLRSLCTALGEKVGNPGGGYGGLKTERIWLTKVLKDHIDDPRLSDWDRDMIRGLE
jgi:hypothetical protein